ncbi:MAG TPA: hypothetical protein PLS63_04775, partial [Microthrixaceae bacterium]|nr:hypothetical protein [Microthrixaceae bacterium]
MTDFSANALGFNPVVPPPYTGPVPPFIDLTNAAVATPAAPEAPDASMAQRAPSTQARPTPTMPAAPIRDDELGVPTAPQI